MTLRRIDRGTWHQYIDNDREVPGVTTILNKALPKPALVNWAANESANYVVNHWDELATMPPAEKLRAVAGARFNTNKAAMARGTQIHDVAEKMARTEPVDVPADLLGPATAYLRFLELWNVQPQWAETPVISRRWGYAGTLDLIGTFGNGHLWLADIKTGKGVYPETALQLAAYRNADFILIDGAEHPMPAVQCCYVFHLLPDAVRVVPIAADRGEFRTFLHALEVYKWLQSHSDAYPIGQPQDTPPVKATT